MASTKKPAPDPELEEKVALFRAKVEAELDFLCRVRDLLAAGRDEEAAAEVRAYYRESHHQPLS